MQRIDADLRCIDVEHQDITARGRDVDARLDDP